MRELENCLRRAVLMCKGDVLSAEHILLDNSRDAIPKTTGDTDLKNTLIQRMEELVPEILKLSEENARQFDRLG